MSHSSVRLELVRLAHMHEGIFHFIFLHQGIRVSFEIVGVKLNVGASLAKRSGPTRVVCSLVVINPDTRRLLCDNRS